MRFRKVSVSAKVYEQLIKLRDEKGFPSISDTIAYIVNVYYDVLSRLHCSTDATYGSIGATHSSTGATKERKKATMLDVIRERKVQFLSEIKPRNPDRFLARARDYGIEVIEGNKDIALADPGFYKVFMEKLHNLNTSNEEKIKKLLDQNEYKLFKFLMENGLIYYDRINSRWKPV